MKSPNHQGQLLTLDDIENNPLATELLGQKQEMLWKICPSDTVITLLYCEIGTVNDQLYNKRFHQIMSIESGSQEEL